MRKEYCGIFGVWNDPDAAEAVYLGLFSLQHRGQEGAGIVSCAGGDFRIRKGMGLVSEVFSHDSLESLDGTRAVGHVRYSTAGESSIGNVQPIVVRYKGSPIAIAHNGNIPSASEWRSRMEDEGIIFATDTDSELILKMMVREKGSWEERLVKVLNVLKGAFSLLVFLPDKMIAVRDGFGFRPLSMGKKGDAVLFSSETCAFDIEGASFIRDLEPGEMVIVDEEGVRSMYLEKQRLSPCIFELVYFARPDSYVFSKSVYAARLNMGAELAREHPVDADFVMPVPDSANMQALGYARESGLPLEFGFMRNHYIGRTFIEPHQHIRDFRVMIKHTPIREAIRGRKVAMVDDSIVRGTTSKKLINLIRNAGAKEVHLLISSPPVIHSCHYGINTPTSTELIANRISVREIAEFLGVDSLHYLSMEGLTRACGGNGYCLSCFDENYPLKPHHE